MKGDRVLMIGKGYVRGKLGGNIHIMIALQEMSFTANCQWLS